MGGGSTALVPYQRMDLWDVVLQRNEERRDTALESSVLPCQKAWSFTVRLISEEGTRWPEGSVVVRVTLDQGDENIYVTEHDASSPRQIHVDGKGPDKGKTSCEVAGWDVTALPEMTLPADDGKTFDVKIRARWIDLRVRYHDRDEVVPGAKLALVVPSGVAVQPTTEHATLHVEKEFTKLDVVTLKEVTMTEGVWEYVP